MGVSDLIAALEALGDRVDDATRQATADTLHILQAAAMKFAPVGTFGNSTNTPGDLRRSILVDGPAPIGDDAWFGRVGPTTVYGRQRELGGDIYPQRTQLLRFRKFGETVFTAHVFQWSQPYMQPAYDTTKADIEAVVVARMTEAVEGA